MIKHIISLLSLLLTTYSFSQNETSDSIRWKRILKTELNDKLFDFKSMDNSSLFGSMWKSAYSGKEIFYFENKEISDKIPYYFVPKKNPQTDSLMIDSCITNTWDVHHCGISQAIIFAFNEDSPFSDESGYPIIVDCGGGGMCFEYPPRTYVVIPPINYISDIRVKEKRMYNEMTNKFEYKTVAVLISPQLVVNIKYDIWLDLGKLEEQTPQIREIDWFKFLINKNYSAEQYMQLKQRIEPQKPQ